MQKLLFVEFLGEVSSVIKQQLAWGEVLSIRRLVFAHLAHQLVGSVIVHKSERSSGEWWETKAEHGTNVSVQLLTRKKSWSYVNVKYKTSNFEKCFSKILFFLVIIIIKHDISWRKGAGKLQESDNTYRTIQNAFLQTQQSLVDKSAGQSELDVLISHGTLRKK